MKTKQIFEKLINQWPAKVLCFVMALLLYFFYQVSQMDTKAIPVKLTVVSDGLLVPVTSFPKHVRVTVRSSPANLSKVSEDEITAVLNINNYVKPGDYKVPVHIEMAPELLLIEPLEVHVSPDTVPVTLDEKTFSYIKVAPSLSGSLPHGYETGTVKITPEAVKVSGPKSMVEQIKEILTDEIKLGQHSESFEQSVNVIRNNTLISVDDNEAVRVFVEVKPAHTEKQFTGVQVYFAYLPPHLQVSDASQTPAVSFKVSGDELAVEGLAVDEYTVQADCSSITQPGEYELQLMYLLPSTVEVKEKSAETVKVKIEAKPKDLGLLNHISGTRR